MSTRLGVHPLTAKVPNMSAEQYAEFKEDIKRTGGNLEPIVVFKGEIIDGRHRYRACKELRLEPFLSEYNERECGPVDAYIRSCQKRRDMTPDQRRVWAQECLEWEREKARERQSSAGKAGRAKQLGGSDKSPDPQEAGKAADKAGEAAGISGKTVERDAKFKADSPVMYQAVADGALSMSTAKAAAAVFDDDAVQRAVLENAKESDDPERAVKDAIKRKRDEDKPAPPKYPASEALKRHFDTLAGIPEYWRQQGGLSAVLKRQDFDPKYREQAVVFIDQLAKQFRRIHTEVSQ